MKRILWSLLFITLLSSSYAGDKIFPFDLNVDRLDNGLQIVTVPFDSPGIVTFFVVVRVGAREEVEDGVTGFAHFFEHCMFRGTERYSKDDYTKVLQEIAGAGNANTSADRTLYYVTGNADEIETMFDIEADRFQYLKYSEHGFKTEAGAVLGEYTKNFSNPYRQLSEKVHNTAFQHHTYEHTTMGFLADVKDMPNQYEYSLKFYDRFYRPEYCTVMIVGDTNHQQVMKLSKKYFGNWKRGNYKPEITPEPEQKAERRAHVQFPGRTNLIAINYKGPGYSDKKNDKVALDMLLELGFGQRSKFYRKLVQEEQKAQGIFPDNQDRRDPFLVGVWVMPYKAEDFAYVEKEVLKTMDEFKTTEVDIKDLEALKSRSKYGFARTLSTPLNVGNNLARSIWLTGDPESLNREYAMMEKVTPADIKRVANTYFKSETLNVVTLSAQESAQ